MNKTKHQKFVNELRAQFLNNVSHKTNLSKSQCADSGESSGVDNTMLKELEKKFNELFGDLDDGDKNGST